MNNQTIIFTDGSDLPILSGTPIKPPPVRAKKANCDQVEKQSHIQLDLFNESQGETEYDDPRRSEN